ncbi:MAG: hypothetical protein QXD77_00260 [Candidatus Aenigmatarchaeota archaeon]
MAEASPKTGSGRYVFSQLGNMIYDELLYCFSFSDVRGLVNEYDRKDLKKDADAFADFRRKLLKIKWDPRKVDAFLSHWLDYAADSPGGDEEDMSFDDALKDRTVDCEEHRTVANALLTRSGYAGDAVNLYYIPDDPEADGEGHATKVVKWDPATTVCNWRLINHYESGMGWIRDFIKKANYYDRLEGRWNGEEFVQEYVDEGTVEESAATVLFQKIRANLAEFVPSPRRFYAGPLKKMDADYMKKFIGRRNALIEELDNCERGTGRYGLVLRQLKFRNQLLRRPDYSLKPMEMRS